METGIHAADSDLPSVPQLLGYKDTDTLETESRERWHHLATTPLTTNPGVLRLQLSLATAAREHRKLTSQLSEQTTVSDVRVEELTCRLRESEEQVDRLRDDCSDWHCKYEGQCWVMTSWVTL